MDVGSSCGLLSRATLGQSIIPTTGGDLLSAPHRLGCGADSQIPSAYFRFTTLLGFRVRPGMLAVFIIYLPTASSIASRAVSNAFLKRSLALSQLFVARSASPAVSSDLAWAISLVTFD